MQLFAGVTAALVALGSTASVPAPRWAPPALSGRFLPIGETTELKTVDVNGDGLRDVVLTHLIFEKDSVPVPITILLNKGAGRFVDATDSLFTGRVPATGTNTQIITADFNGDGRTDMFFTDMGSDNLAIQNRHGWQNTLVLSAPGGKLVDASTNLPQQQSFTHSAAAAGVDANGTVDLFVGNLNCCGDHSPPEFLLNDGTGHFTVATDRLQGVPLDQWGNFQYAASAFVDVNGDRSPDLVLGHMENWSRSLVLLNDGHGRFSAFSDLPPLPYANGILLDIAGIDVNRDGATDLVVASTPNEPYYVGSSLQVLVNDGHGTFHDETAARISGFPAKSWPNDLFAEDLNGDGALDLVQQNAPPGIVAEVDPVYAWLNNGKGVFRRINGPASGRGVSTGGVGLVNGAGPHALFSVDAWDGRYYVTRQLPLKKVKRKPHG